MPTKNKNYFIKKFNGQPTLFDLLEFRGYDVSDRDKIINQINSGEIHLGHVWENALSEFMPFTKKLSGNAMSMDWSDHSDGKFAMSNPAGNINYATVGGWKNKRGALRVCVCSVLDSYRLHFLIIPAPVHDDWSAPLKLAFSRRSGKPSGVKWDQYDFLKVNFDLVSAELQKLTFKYNSVKYFANEPSKDW
jgi:hypothetical protein